MVNKIIVGILLFHLVFVGCSAKDIIIDLKNKALTENVLEDRINGDTSKVVINLKNGIISAEKTYDVKFLLNFNNIVIGDAELLFLKNNSLNIISIELRECKYNNLTFVTWLKNLKNLVVISKSIYTLNSRSKKSKVILKSKLKLSRFDLPKLQRIYLEDMVGDEMSDFLLNSNSIKYISTPVNSFSFSLINDLYIKKGLKRFINQYYRGESKLKNYMFFLSLNDKPLSKIKNKLQLIPIRKNEKRPEVESKSSYAVVMNSNSFSTVFTDTELKKQISKKLEYGGKHYIELGRFDLEITSVRLVNFLSTHYPLGIYTILPFGKSKIRKK